MTVYRFTDKQLTALFDKWKLAACKAICAECARQTPWVRVETVSRRETSSIKHQHGQMVLPCLAAAIIERVTLDHQERLPADSPLWRLIHPSKRSAAIAKYAKPVTP